MEKTCWAGGYVSQLTNGFAIFLQKKIPGAAVLPLLGTQCEAAEPSWMRSGRLLLAFTNTAHCKAWILPESQQRCGEEREELAGKSHQGMAKKVGDWLGIHIVLLCMNKGSWLAQKRTTTTGLLQECIYLH